MLISRGIVLACVIAGSAALLHAQSPSLPAAVRAAADAISEEQLAWDLAYLASDELGGRNTPSPGFDAAADYIIARLTKAGLKPAGDNGTFKQHYDLHESRVDANASAIVIGGQQFALGRDFAMRTLAGPLQGDLPVVYAGHGWVVPDRKIDPYAGLDVKGKLVLVHGPGTLPRGVQIQQLGRVAIGAQTPFAAAAERGAAGILFITRAADLVRWDEIRNANMVRRELEPAVPSAYSAIPITSVMLAPPLTTALLAGETLDGTAATRIGDQGDFPASFQLKKTVSVRVATSATTIHKPYNVVAMLEGSDPKLKDEAITVFSHLDGAVGSREIAGDRIYNSADDNASGSAATLNIAEQMAKAPKPKRTVIFVWDSGEEQGLWGTRQFVHKPPVPLDRIVAHFNIDMIGASRRPGSADALSNLVTERNEVFLIGPKTLSRQASVMLDRVNADYLKMRYNSNYDTPDSEFFYPRTDAGPFLERGILTLGFTTGIHNRYHLPADEARVLDPVQVLVIAKTVLASVWMIGDAAERPGIDQPMPRTVPKYR
ncbi:MAG TPA: M28 family peptidase [Vicinamibacterales bacterium]|nr:M28 family peptidase [Vicinamibacterales bacterium]